MSQVNINETTGQPVSAKTLLILGVLGLLAALWSGVQWYELIQARNGGSTFCGVNSTVNCTDVWDSAFASNIHKYTHIPVAGWGMIWAFIAMILPMWARRNVENGQDNQALVTATRLTGLAGAISVLIFASVSASLGKLCLTCLGTYVLVGIYASMSLAGLKNGFAMLPKGISYATGSVIVGMLVAYYPGIKTPQSQASQEKDLMELAKQSQQNQNQNQQNQQANTANTANNKETPFGKGQGSGNTEQDTQLARFIDSLPPEVKKDVSDTLWHYQQSTPKATWQPRHVDGSADAPVKITEFTDPRCGHCAQLFTTLHEIEKSVPPTLFSVESKLFPLDATCNEFMPPDRKQNPSVSCTIAKIEVCLEGTPNYKKYVGSVFENQGSLSVEKGYELAKPYMDAAKLKACVESPDTQKKIKEDSELAMKYNLEGTPLVLINGKEGFAYGPFLFALILSGGRIDHPAFAKLPAPEPIPQHQH